MFGTILKAVRGTAKPRRRREARKTPAFHLRMESLEDRVLPATLAFNAGTYAYGAATLNSTPSSSYCPLSTGTKNVTLAKVGNNSPSNLSRSEVDLEVGSGTGGQYVYLDTYSYAYGAYTSAKSAAFLCQGNSGAGPVAITIKPNTSIGEYNGQRVTVTASAWYQSKGTSGQNYVYASVYTPLGKKDLLNGFDTGNNNGRVSSNRFVWTTTIGSTFYVDERLQTTAYVPYSKGGYLKMDFSYTRASSTAAESAQNGQETQGTKGLADLLLAPKESSTGKLALMSAETATPVGRPKTASTSPVGRSSLSTPAAAANHSASQIDFAEIASDRRIGSLDNDMITDLLKSRMSAKNTLGQS